MDKAEEIRRLNQHTKSLKKDKFGWNSSISTILAGDTGKYETAVFDIRYVNDVIVLEEYETEDAAIAGHDRWLNLISTYPPKSLTNVSTSKLDHHGYGKVFELKISH